MLLIINLYLIFDFICILLFLDGEEGEKEAKSRSGSEKGDTDKEGEAH